ncbi:MAG: diaminopimelate epimerase, partial [Muribaculaceae bacterium]|nr:diaminopimelate epimerase [Muribaculaceae bacterium]
IILALPSDVADFRMRIFNADGSEARMCGNGSRCVGKLVSDRGLTSADEITLDTLAGVKTLQLHRGTDGKVDTVTVAMGRAVVERPLELTTSAGPVTVIPVDMGNPHAVVFIDNDPDDYDVHRIGRELELDPVWPDRANIEFARVLSPDRVKVRVWERGSGETMACGTGACATAAAALASGRCGRLSTIGLPGGDLIIDVDPATMEVTMTGPAVTSFTGEVGIDF